jgi:hypothetical protein
MTVQYSADVNNAALDAKETAIGTAPTLEFWSGSKPANCAAADTGTKLATGVLPSNWMADAAAASKAKAGIWSVTGLAAAGTGTAVTYFRITQSGTCHMQGSVTVTGGGGDMTVDNTSIAENQVAVVNTFTIATATANT